MLAQGRRPTKFWAEERFVCFQILASPPEHSTTRPVATWVWIEGKKDHHELSNNIIDNVISRVAILVTGGFQQRFFTLFEEAGRKKGNRLIKNGSSFNSFELEPLAVTHCMHRLYSSPECEHWEAGHAFQPFPWWMKDTENLAKYRQMNSHYTATDLKFPLSTSGVLQLADVLEWWRRGKTGLAKGWRYTESTSGNWNAGFWVVSLCVSSFAREGHQYWRVFEASRSHTDGEC